MNRSAGGVVDVSTMTEGQRNQLIVRALQKNIVANKTCFECGQKGVTYVDVTCGTFVCASCSGALRGLAAPHRVKSISMSTFTADDVALLVARGNAVVTWAFQQVSSYAYKAADSKDLQLERRYRNVKIDQLPTGGAPPEMLQANANVKNTVNSNGATSDGTIKVTTGQKAPVLGDRMRLAAYAPAPGVAASLVTPATPQPAAVHQPPPMSPNPSLASASSANKSAVFSPPTMNSTKPVATADASWCSFEQTTKAVSTKSPSVASGSDGDAFGASNGGHSAFPAFNDSWPSAWAAASSHNGGSTSSPPSAADMPRADSISSAASGALSQRSQPTSTGFPGHTPIAPQVQTKQSLLGPQTRARLQQQQHQHQHQQQQLPPAVSQAASGVSMNSDISDLMGLNFSTGNQTVAPAPATPTTKQAAKPVVNNSADKYAALAELDDLRALSSGENLSTWSVVSSTTTTATATVEQAKSSVATATHSMYSVSAALPAGNPANDPFGVATTMKQPPPSHHQSLNNGTLNQHHPYQQQNFFAQQQGSAGASPYQHFGGSQAFAGAKPPPPAYNVFEPRHNPSVATSVTNDPFSSAFGNNSSESEGTWPPHNHPTAASQPDLFTGAPSVPHYYSTLTSNTSSGTSAATPTDFWQTTTVATPSHSAGAAHSTRTTPSNAWTSSGVSSASLSNPFVASFNGVGGDTDDTPVANAAPVSNSATPTASARPSSPAMVPKSTTFPAFPPVTTSASSFANMTHDGFAARMNSDANKRIPSMPSNVSFNSTGDPFASFGVSFDNLNLSEEAAAGVRVDGGLPTAPTTDDMTSFASFDSKLNTLASEDDASGTAAWASDAQSFPAADSPTLTASQQDLPSFRNPFDQAPSHEQPSADWGFGATNGNTAGGVPAEVAASWAFGGEASGKVGDVEPVVEYDTAWATMDGGEVTTTAGFGANFASSTNPFS